MTINLTTEIVSTRHDAPLRMNYYTVERGGRRWTVGIPSDDIGRHGANMKSRRAHLANALTQVMQGPADGEA